jgi:hypothetical protein
MPRDLGGDRTKAFLVALGLSVPGGVPGDARSGDDEEEKAAHPETNRLRGPKT